MRLRIQQLGGELTIQTGGSGTRVTAILPMAPAAEAEHQSS
jgi:signal transduction histidine kinase